MCERRHRLVVTFADTDGRILRGDDEDSTLATDLNLGSCLYTESGLVVVDRTPTDETTRLWVRDIVNLIKYTRRTGLYGPDGGTECECGEAEVIVYLPRMSGDMIEEAEHQRSFYSISKNTTLVAV